MRFTDKAVRPPLVSVGMKKWTELDNHSVPNLWRRNHAEIPVSPFPPESHRRLVTWSSASKR